MSMEDYNSIESSDTGGNAAEISEKYKESAKKAAAGIKRTQKDEGKAKKYDLMLAKFLWEMIRKKKYDILLNDLFHCLDLWYGTNFLLGILSLVYLPISDEIRRVSWLEEINFSPSISPEKQNFDGDALSPNIQKRVNQWIGDMENIARFEASSIVTKRTLGLILYDEKIRQFTKTVFMFFFTELNIVITDSKATWYSKFILGELEKSLKSHMPVLTKKWSEEGLEI